MTEALDRLRKKMDMMCLSNIKLCTGVSMDYNGVVYNELDNNDTDTEVKIPNGATEIGPFAFTSHMIALKKIELPPTVRVIRERAFENSYVQEVYIPGSVEQIGTCAFSGTELKTLEIEKYSNLEFISAEAFSNCKLNVLELPSVYGEIASKVFESSEIKRIIINAMQINVGAMAFRGAELIEIDNKYGVIKSIGFGAFYNCRYLRHIDLRDTEVIEEEGLSGCERLGEIVIEKAVTIEKHAFLSCKIDKLRITTNKSYGIQASAFNNCVIKRLEATEYYYEMLLNNTACKVNEYILIE